jgi:hypothetical protein
MPPEAEGLNMQTNATLMSSNNNTVPARGHFCLGDEFERIHAFGLALKWEDKPYGFVVARYREISAIQNEEERILAFGKALGWDDKPYEFIAAKYSEIAATL